MNELTDEDIFLMESEEELEPEDFYDDPMYEQIMELITDISNVYNIHEKYIVNKISVDYQYL